MIHLLMKNVVKGQHKQHRHVAVVTRGGAILSVAANGAKEHAEVRALKKLTPDARQGTKVWSMRLSKGGRLGMALPCPNCEKFMRENGVKKVYYTDELGLISKVRYR